MLHRHPEARNTASIGDIVYIQDECRPLGFPRFFTPAFRNPWIVEAWLNREYSPCVPSMPEKTFVRGGHLAIVRSLRDGRRMTVANWILKMSSEL